MFTHLNLFFLYIFKTLRKRHSNILIMSTVVSIFPPSNRHVQTSHFLPLEISHKPTKQLNKISSLIGNYCSCYLQSLSQEGDLWSSLVSENRHKFYKDHTRENTRSKIISFWWHRPIRVTTDLSLWCGWSMGNVHALLNTYYILHSCPEEKIGLKVKRYVVKVKEFMVNFPLILWICHW